MSEQRRAWFTAEVLFDWPTHTYGEIQQAILDALNTKGIFSAVISVSDAQMDCAACGECD